MEKAFFANVASSRTRLEIVSLLSQRPRTLRELAKLTGISVQGVLRQLKALDKLGLVQESTISSKEFPTRRLYSARRMRVTDYSIEDLMIVKAAKQASATKVRVAPVVDIESIAGEILLERRRVRDRARRLARTIDRLNEIEVRLMKMIEALNLSDDERLVLQTVFTEETLQEAEDVLSKVQGVPNARRSIDKALAKARRSVSR